MLAGAERPAVLCLVREVREVRAVLCCMHHGAAIVCIGSALRSRGLYGTAVQVWASWWLQHCSTALWNDHLL